MSKLADMFGANASDTFLGLPRIELADPLPAEAAAVVLGVDTATPYRSVGAYCAGGARAIRAGSGDFAANLSHMNFDLGGPVMPSGVALFDAGDLPVSPDMAEKNRTALSAAIQRVLEGGAVPVVLGGDDSIPYPVLQALEVLGEPVHILQVDAHIDWRDEVQGERFGLSSPMRRASEMAHIDRIVQVGARGIGSARVSDVEDAAGAGALILPMREVARDGFLSAIDALPEGAAVALAFDWDVLDPAIMPAVIARTPGGMGYWDAVELISAASEKCRIVAATFAEFMVERDLDGQGARNAAGLVATTLGCIARARAGV